METPFITSVQADKKIQDSYFSLQQQIDPLVSGFKGVIDLTTPSPTESGLYQPTESGTYTNFGGTVVDLTEGYTTISFDGVNYGKQVVPILISGVIEKDNAGAVSGGEVFEKINKVIVKSNQLLDSTIFQNKSLNNSGAFGVASDNWVSTSFFSIEKNTSFILSGIEGVSASYPRLVIKDALDNVIYTLAALGVTNSSNVVFTTPNVDNIKIAFILSSRPGSGSYIINGTSQLFKAAMLNKGNVPLPFSEFGYIFDKKRAGFGTYNTVYVSPLGSDLNEGNLKEYPVLTLKRAKEVVKEYGEVILLQGDYESPDFLLSDFSILKGNQGDRVRFIYGSKVKTATLTLGKNRVFQSTYATVITANSHIWQHDIEDEDTLISINERHPFHKGKRTRLESTRVYPATSIQEIEDTTDVLMWYQESGVLYFSKKEGSDIAVNYMVIPINLPKIPNVKNVFISNIEFLYQSISTSNLSGKISDVRCGFTRSSGSIIYDKSVGIVFERCEAFAGSNDGFNGHVSGNFGNPLPYSNQLQVTMIDCYAHDNGDDGDSWHEFSVNNIHGGLYEYNGNGVTPASGGHGTCHGVMTRKNGIHRWSPLQEGTGFSAQGNAIDNAIGTNLICYNCISIDDIISFSGRDESSNWINCISVRAVTSSYVGGTNHNSI